MLQNIDSKKPAKIHFHDRTPDKFGVTVQDNPNKVKHGIGAILENFISALVGIIINDTFIQRIIKNQERLEI